MSLIKAWFCLPVWLIFSAGLSVLAEAQEKEAGAGEEPAAASASGAAPLPAVAGGAAEAQGLGAFGRMLPVGQRNVDVKIPSFKDGFPSSLVRAGSMTRVDADNMVIDKVDIRLFGPTRDRDVRVQLVTGMYHMPSQILSSEERSRVSRDDFQLEGDSMVFDTKTQQGKMVGNVKMVIFDTASFTTQPLKGQEAPAAAVPKTDPPSTSGRPAEASEAPAKKEPVPANEKK